MQLFPEARAVVALSWTVEMSGEYADTSSRGRSHGYLDDRVIAYTRQLAAWAVAADIRLQFYLSGETLEDGSEWLGELARQGHALDQHTGRHQSLATVPLAELGDEVARTNELFRRHLGAPAQGLRGPGSSDSGLGEHPEVQQVLLQQGLKFASSQYATKGPGGKYDVFADKNACMIIKHHQPRTYDSGLWEVPISGYSDRHFFDQQKRTLAEWIQHLQSCLDFAYDMGGLLYAPALHPDTHARHDPGLEAMTALVEYAGRKSEPVRFCTHREAVAASEAISSGKKL